MGCFFLWAKTVRLGESEYTYGSRALENGGLESAGCLVTKLRACADEFICHTHVYAESLSLKGVLKYN